MANVYVDGGKYRGKIAAWGLAESSAKKTPQVYFKIAIENELDPDGEAVECPRYERTIYRALTENTVDRLVEDLKRLGFKGQSFAELDPTHDPHHDFAGQEVDVICKHEEYNGKVNERFDFAFGGPPVAAMPADKMSKLDKLFGAKLKAKPAAAAKPKPAAAPSKTLDQEADDVF